MVYHRAREQPHICLRGGVRFPTGNALFNCLLVFNVPFTLCKGLLDVALCFLIYKPLSPLLHK